MTNIYITRHSKKESNFKHLNEHTNYELFNYIIPLSIEGEKRAKDLSELSILSNIKSIYSSSYSRTIATSKYIADKYNLKINIIEELGERNIGVKYLKDIPKNYEKHQIEDHDYKIGNGESINDAGKRLENVINDLVIKEKGNDILIVTHAAIMMSYFFIVGNITSKKIKFNNKTIIPLNYNWDSPDLFKLTFNEENKLESIDHIILNYSHL